MSRHDRPSNVAPDPLRPSIGEQTLARRRKSSRRRLVVRWVKRGVLGLLALAVVYAIVLAWLPEPITIDVGVAERGALQVFVEEDGRTRVRERYVVSAPLSGTLQRIDLEPGDAVAEGAIVARLVPPAPMLLDARTRAELEAQLEAALARERQAEAALARASAARDLAVTMAARARKLAPDALSASELDRFETEERVAVEDHAAAQQMRKAAAAEVRGLRASLGEAGAGDAREVAVRAPAGGSVLRVVRESAGPVVAGEPLLEVGDTRAIEVVVDVLSSDAVAIAPGTEVWIEQWGGANALHGRVTRVEPSAFTHISALGVEEQRVYVIAALDDPPASLGDGFRVEARILTWEGADVIAVPASAVFRNGDGWAVYVVEGDTARLRAIEVGHRGRHAVEVTRGIDAGAPVVLYPGDKLRDGAAVQPRG